MLRTIAALLLFAMPAHADILVTFDEGAPKDRFTILNADRCPLDDASVTIDLSGSAGKLIFDVTGTGAGIEVFQPFEAVTGASALSSLPRVRDGDSAVTLAIHRLAPGDRIAFTIDVDDTTSGYGIMVSGSEIDGATVQIDKGSSAAGNRFGPDATARVPFSSCLS